MASSLFLQLNGGYSTPGPVGIGTTSPKASTLTLGSAISATAELATPGTVDTAVVAGGSLAASTTYYFKVTAFDAAGNETQPSPQASATTTDVNKTVNLSWNPVPGSESYWLYYGTTTALGKRIQVDSNPVYVFAADSGAAHALPAASSVAYHTIVGDSGSQSTYLGVGAGKSNVYADNGAAVTAGYHNVYLGQGAGESDTDGYYNVIVGTDAALFATHAGHNNVLLGASTASNIAGYGNVIVGDAAGQTLTDIHNSVLIGQLAGKHIAAKTGGPDANIMIGQQSGLNYTGATSGGNNTFVGTYSDMAAGDPLVATLTNSTALGNAARITASNQVVLGNWSVTQTLLRGSQEVLAPGTLGSESLTNPNLTSGTDWSRAGDFALASDAATYTHSAGSGSITQANASLAVAGRGNRWYKFVYTVSGKTGSPACTVTTGFAAAATPLTLATGVNTVYIQAKAAPGDFVISCTSSAAATVTFDTLSLKEVEGGDVRVGGSLYLGSWNTQTTVGAAGGASALPATPLGYILVTIDGTQVAIPYFVKS